MQYMGSYAPHDGPFDSAKSTVTHHDQVDFAGSGRRADLLAGIADSDQGTNRNRQAIGYFNGMIKNLTRLFRLEGFDLLPAPIFMLPCFFSSTSSW